MLARVEKAGGSIVVPKTEIGNDFGFFALFIDTEGNKVGLHSMG
jgi:predicted enzyme related to lactoylglutathione lyase